MYDEIREVCGVRKLAAYGFGLKKRVGAVSGPDSNRESYFSIVRPAMDAARRPESAGRTGPSAIGSQARYKQSREHQTCVHFEHVQRADRVAGTAFRTRIAEWPPVHSFRAFCTAGSGGCASRTETWFWHTAASIPILHTARRARF